MILRVAAMAHMMLPPLMLLPDYFPDFLRRHGSFRHGQQASMPLR